MKVSLDGIKKGVQSLLMTGLIFGVLTACGGQPTTDVSVRQGAAEAVQTQEPSSETVETRSFTDMRGEKTIPLNPQRVVAAQYIEPMLALGVKPVGAPAFLLDSPYIGERREGIQDIGRELNLEKVLELQPDLIVIGDYTDVAIYEQLNQIAPTVVIPWVGFDVFGHLDQVAAIFGKESEAKAWKEQFAINEAAARDAISGVVQGGMTVTIIRASGKDELQVYGSRNIGHVLYRSLELQPPQAVRNIWGDNPQFVSDSISIEVLPELAGDYLFVMTDLEAREQGGVFSQLEDLQLWKDLPAVKNDRVYFVDQDIWLGYTPLGLQAQLDDAVRMLRGD